MAKYRQTVLTAFRQVEADLATPRILAHNEDLTGSRKPTFIRDSSLQSFHGRNSRWHSQLIQSKPFGTRNVKDNGTGT